MVNARKLFNYVHVGHMQPWKKLQHNWEASGLAVVRTEFWPSPAHSLWTMQKKGWLGHRDLEGWQMV